MAIVATLVSGLLLAVLLYQALEFWGTYRDGKRAPQGPATGLEALVGSDAEVIEQFERRGPENAAIGRVKIGSESWQAELTDGAGRLASVGDHVSVVGIAGSILKVTWR